MIVLLSPATMTAPAELRLIFDSEFTGSTLNLSQWSTGTNGVPGITIGNNTLEDDCYSPSQVRVTQGNLVITAIARSVTCGGRRQPYLSGSITTKYSFHFRYGYVEARVWLPGATDVSDWPAVWAEGTYASDSGGEIDIVEGIDGHVCVHFHNRAGGPGRCLRNFTPGWHVFGAYWQPNMVGFYYDGNILWTDKEAVSSAPMYFIVNLSISASISPPAVVPAVMKIDFIRVWELPRPYSPG